MNRSYFIAFFGTGVTAFGFATLTIPLEQYTNVPTSVAEMIGIGLFLSFLGLVIVTKALWHILDNYI